MLTFFFIIVFIAELIIVCSLISWILKLDRKICELNECFAYVNPLIQDSFVLARISINKAALSLNNIQIKINQKKDEFKTKILKGIISAMLFLLLNNNGKRMFSSIELVFSVIDLGKILLKYADNLKKEYFIEKM